MKIRPAIVGVLDSPPGYIHPWHTNPPLRPIICLCLCVILSKWRLAGRKTRVETLTNDNYVSGETIANFLDRGFLT